MPAATAPPSCPTADRHGPESRTPRVLSTCPGAAGGAERAPACPHCGRVVPPPLRRCRRRRCPGYAAIWAGDQRQKLFANLNAYADQVPAGIKAPRVLVSAATAPGVRGGMEWDEHRCAGLGPHEHSGRLGCRVRTSQATAWNESAAARWRLLHGEAYRRCVREGLKPWLLVRVWEMQKRGLLHAHPVLAYSTPRERESSNEALPRASGRASNPIWLRLRRAEASGPRAASRRCVSLVVLRHRQGQEDQPSGVGAVELDAPLDYSRLDGPDSTQRDHDANSSPTPLRVGPLASLGSRNLVAHRARTAGPLVRLA